MWRAKGSPLLDTVDGPTAEETTRPWGYLTINRKPGPVTSLSPDIIAAPRTTSCPWARTRLSPNDLPGLSAESATVPLLVNLASIPSLYPFGSRRKMTSSVLEVAEGSVTFLFYLPASTSTTEAAAASTTRAIFSSRRSSSATYHKAAASQSTDLGDTSIIIATTTSAGHTITYTTTPTGYAPAVAFSTYAYSDPSLNATVSAGPEPKK